MKDVIRIEAERRSPTCVHNLPYGWEYEVGDGQQPGRRR